MFSTEVIALIYTLNFNSTNTHEKAIWGMKLCDERGKDSKEYANL